MQPARRVPESTVKRIMSDKTEKKPTDPAKRRGRVNATALAAGMTAGEHVAIGFGVEASVAKPGALPAPEGT